MTDPDRRDRALSRALLDKPADARLYMTNGVFHQGIDQLVAWLPLWVQAMADAAEVAQADIDRRVEQAKHAGVFGGFLVDGGMMVLRDCGAEACPGHPPGTTDCGGGPL